MCVCVWREEGGTVGDVENGQWTEAGGDGGRGEGGAY